MQIFYNATYCTTMQSKEVGKFRSKYFRCNKRLDLFTMDVLNRFYCILNLH